MIAEGFCQLPVDLIDLLAVSGRGVAVVMAFAKEGPSAVFIHPKNFRISVCQPVGTSTGWSSQVYGHAVGVEPVDDLLHPVKLVMSLFGFQHGPGKDSKGNTVNACFFKVFQVLFQDIRPVQPLIRVIVTAVEKVIGGKWVRSLFHKQVLS